MQELSRTLLLLISIIGAASVTGCTDVYTECMKEEKRRNAYLAEADYKQASSQKCKRKARQAKK